MREREKEEGGLWEIGKSDRGLREEVVWMTRNRETGMRGRPGGWGYGTGTETQKRVENFTFCYSLT